LGFAVDAHDQVVRALAGRAAGAVGDRDKRRLQFLQLSNGGKQFLGGLVRLGGEELETKRGPVFPEDVLNVHGAGHSSRYESGSGRCPVRVILALQAAGGLKRWDKFATCRRMTSCKLVPQGGVRSQRSLLKHAGSRASAAAASLRASSIRPAAHAWW